MSEKQTTQSKNDLNRHFSKEDVWMAKRHKKRCSSVLIKRLQTMNSGEAIEKREPSYTVGGNANLYNHYGEQCEDSFKNWK